MKHTKGPWTASEMFEGDKPTGWRVISNGYQLAHCCAQGTDTNIDEMGANARLIATAPELFAILEDLLLCCELNLDDTEFATIDLIKMANRIIKKAKGEV